MISRDETRESSPREKNKELSVDRGRLIKWKRRVIFELYKTVSSLSAHNTEFYKFLCFEISVGHKFSQFLHSWFRHFRILNANFPRIGLFRKCKEGFLGFPRGNIFITQISIFMPYTMSSLPTALGCLTLLNRTSSWRKWTRKHDPSV